MGLWEVPLISRWRRGDCMQSYVRESMRQTLIVMSPNLDVPQELLLNEFDRLFPADLPAAGAALPVDSAAAVQAQKRLKFEHDCE